MPNFVKLFQKTEEEKTLLNYFLEACMTLIPKTEKNIKKKRRKERKLRANITEEHRCKNSQQNISKLILIIHKKDHTP